MHGRPNATADFLAGGGETGALMRAHEWSVTPLGPAEAWPPPLKTLVAVMLGSQQPMLIVWGPEHTTLYNDGYATMCGSRHPAALGRPFDELWHDIWDQVEPILARTYAGEATHMDDIAFVMHRHGYPEETHFAFGYTPVRDDRGAVAGMFCACTETTGQVLAERRNIAERERLQQLFEQAPGFMAMLSGPEHVFEIVNPAYMQLIGHRDVLGKPVREALPEVEGQGFFELLNQVYASGEAFRGNALRAGLQRAPGAPVEERFIDLVYQPVVDADGRVTGIFVEGSDATERVQAEAALRESEAFTRRVLESSTDCIKVLSFEGTLEFMSAGGMGVMEIEDFSRFKGAYWPDFWQGEEHVKALDAVARAKVGGTGRFQGYTPTAKGNVRYWDVIVTPILGADGQPEKLLSISRDISEQREMEEALRLRGEEFYALADNISSLCWIAYADGHIFWYNRRWYEYTGTTPESQKGWGWQSVHDPDMLPAIVARWRHSIDTGEPFEMTFPLKGADGTFRPFLTRVLPIRDDTDRIVRWFGTNVDITEQREAEIRLEQRVAERTAERNLLASIVETTDAFIQVADRDYRWLAINKASADEFERIFGIRPRVGDSMLDFLADRPEHQAAVRAVWSRALAGEEFTIVEEFGDPSLARGCYEIKFNTLRDEGGERVGAYQIVYDVTERRLREEALAEAQAALRQSQKMEAVGQLTGGIAHDFNNLLAGIVGSLDLMQTRISQGRTDAVERYAKAAMSSAQRAAALTHRLLAFSRRQPLDPKPVNANQLITSMEDLLRRTIGPLHALEFVTAGGLWTTLCDPNQLESAILNLAINARDAMPEGGKLTIETCNAHLDDAYVAAQRDVTPGQYICVCITDTGTGMSPDVIARAFEPFFTTKPLGQGTGLGLSMVYGFAKQSEGHLKIYSEEGKGTTVKIYLPRHRGAADLEEAVVSPAEAPRAEAGETVLVVEDEPVIRDLIVEVLQDLGYRALEAADGPSGLKVLQSRKRIDLLVTDVGLPGLNGRQLADYARERRPTLKVLFITGYAENATIANGFLDPGMAMITKPFAVEALASKIRSMIRGR